MSRADEIGFLYSRKATLGFWTKCNRQLPYLRHINCPSTATMIPTVASIFLGTASYVAHWYGTKMVAMRGAQIFHMIFLPLTGEFNPQNRRTVVVLYQVQKEELMIFHRRPVSTWFSVLCVILLVFYSAVASHSRNCSTSHY